MTGRPWPVAASVVAVLALGAVAGCGGGGGGPAGKTGGSATPHPVTRCGTARTAAGVPVEIEVERGAVSCGLALAVERAYAHALASGKVPGNGGGAPVTIRGWICQGFNTPQVLASGHASACRKGGARILAVLPEPSSSATSF
jgi:hypothetical protein